MSRTKCVVSDCHCNIVCFDLSHHLWKDCQQSCVWLSNQTGELARRIFHRYSSSIADIWVEDFGQRIVVWRHQRHCHIRQGGLEYRRSVQDCYSEDSRTSRVFRESTNYFDFIRATWFRFWHKNSPSRWINSDEISCLIKGFPVWVVVSNVRPSIGIWPTIQSSGERCYGKVWIRLALCYIKGCLWLGHCVHCERAKGVSRAPRYFRQFWLIDINSYISLSIVHKSYCAWPIDWRREGFNLI